MFISVISVVVVVAVCSFQLRLRKSYSRYAVPQPYLFMVCVCISGAHCLMQCNIIIIHRFFGVDFFSVSVCWCVCMSVAKAFNMETININITFTHLMYITLQNLFILHTNIGNKPRGIKNFTEHK